MGYYKQRNKLKCLMEDGQVKEGATLVVHLDPKASYTISAAKSGCDEQQVFTQDQENYGNVDMAKYTGVCKRGMAQFALLISPQRCKEVKLAGKAGYMNGWRELNALCDALYSQPQHYVVAHNMTEKEFKSMPRYMRKQPENVEMWFSTPFRMRKGIRTKYLGMKSVHNGHVKETALLYTSGKKEELAEKRLIWPVLWIPINVIITRYFSTEYGESNFCENKILYLER